MKGRSRDVIAGSIEDIKRADKVRAAVIEHLQTIEAQRIRTKSETGYSEPGQVDLKGCITALQALPHPTAKQIQTVLIDHRIHPDVLTYLRANTGVKAEIGSEDLKGHMQQACTNAFEDAGMLFKNNGDEFLRNLIASSIGSKKNVDATHLQKLQQLATGLQRQGYPPNEVAAVYIIYACFNERSLSVTGRSGNEVVLERLEAIVRGQSQLDPKTVEGERQKQGTFFARLLRCISVYADISQEVMNKSPQIAQEVRDRATKGLSQFLERQELSSPRWEKQPAVDPFVVLQNELTDKSEDNPWIRESLEGTPFDARKFRALITQDVPRGLLAESVVALNGYKDWRLARRATSLKNSIEGTRQKRLRPSPKVNDQCVELIQDYLDQYPERKRDIDLDDVVGELVDAPELFEWFKEIENRSVWRSKTELRQTGDVHPIAALLRVIRPKDIVEDEQIRREFMDLFEEMQVPSTKGLDIGSSERITANKRIAIIAASVRDVLAEDDPYLDIPIVGADEQLSLRMMLMKFAHAKFDTDVIEKGPYANLEQQISPNAQLFVPQHLRGFSPERLKTLKKNFDTAAGVQVYPDSKNMWTRPVAEAWSRFPNFYERASKFSKSLVQRFYALDDSYRVAFYRSATSAIGDVVAKLITVNRGDRVFITNQEYSSITEEFKDRGAVIGKNEILYTNDREAGRSYTAREMFEQLQKRIADGDGSLPRAFILSSKTRFGDAPCAGRGSTPKITGLQEFIGFLKEEYPDIPVIVDASQSVGRNDIGERSIKDLGCDIFVNSGGKAMGLGDIATLILKTKFPDGQPNWLHLSPEGKKDPGRDWLALTGLVRDDEDPVKKLQPGRAGENSVAIAELGMVMQYLMGKVDAWSTNAIEPTSSMREVAAEHMRSLTQYFLSKTDEYHTDLLTTLNLSLGNEDLEDTSYAEQFGCRVVYPVHRSFKDYSGIVTVTFPNIAYLKEGETAFRSDYLPKELAKNGFKILPCLNGNHGMRISFNMAQTTADIDELFKAIKSIHVEFLRKHPKMRDGSIRTYEDLRTQTPNVPGDWIPA